MGPQINIIGSFFPSWMLCVVIGIAAALGLGLFFVGAIVVVMRVRWYSHLPWPTTYLLFAIESLALRLAVS